MNDDEWLILKLSSVVLHYDIKYTKPAFVVKCSLNVMEGSAGWVGVGLGVESFVDDVDRMLVCDGSLVERITLSVVVRTDVAL